MPYIFVRYHYVKAIEHCITLGYATSAYVYARLLGRAALRRMEQDIFSNYR